MGGTDFFSKDKQVLRGFWSEVHLAQGCAMSSLQVQSWLSSSWWRNSSRAS